MQGTWVWSLIQEDSTCSGAAKPMHSEPACPRAGALQLEKPPQWEICLLQLEKACVQQQQQQQFFLVDINESPYDKADIEEC